MFCVNESVIAHILEVILLQDFNKELKKTKFQTNFYGFQLKNHTILKALIKGTKKNKTTVSNEPQTQ